MPLPWKLNAGTPAPAAELSRALGLHPLVAAILARRGVDSPEAAQRFLKPSLSQLHDPFALLGMDAAVAAIVDALAQGKRILVSGDYDVDGITSSALLTQFLREAGAPGADYFIPNRFDHGYGLTARTVDALLERQPELIVTVDNGITAVDEVARLHAAGVQTVITDHHLPREAGVPAGIVVNPQQPGCPYPFKKISGVGVTFKLVTALRKALRDAGWWSEARPEPNLKALLDLVAVGTVADVMPLVEENRVLVAHGLQVMNAGFVRPGLKALIALGKSEAVSARTIAFRIAPRINAAGRMSDGALAVRLLLAKEMPEALDLAAALEAENNARRSKGEEMLAEARARIEADRLAANGEIGAGIVVHSEAFHEGIIGITAAKLVEEFHRPVVVLARNGDGYKGSARSVPGFNVTEAFHACAGLLGEYGGHAGAAGCRVPLANVQAFRERFAEACAKALPGAEPPAVELEGRIDADALDEELVRQLETLEPFGYGNEAPSFLIEQSGLPEPKSFSNGHLRWNLGYGKELIGWRLAESLPITTPGLAYRITLGFNEYKGQRKIQGIVEEFRTGM